MVLFSAACTCGRATPASADAPVILPVLVRKCLRDVPAFESSLIANLHSKLLVTITVPHGELHAAAHLMGIPALSVSPSPTVIELRRDSAGRAPGSRRPKPFARAQRRLPCL